MSSFRELAILFHAWGLESRFYNTKICSIIKEVGRRNLSRDDFVKNIPMPREEFKERARDEVDQAIDLGICIVTVLDESYPKDLLEIDDPPMVLFVMTKNGCDSDLFKGIDLCYGVVGARKASIYGESVANNLAKGMSNLGMTIVSGLAMGIDARAHRGALKGSSRYPTIAIVGSGLLQLYPRINKDLAESIIESDGYIISEYGLNEVSRTHLFPRRNRIISGLSKGIVIVEAKERSGSLITARLALEQGREVYSVPGPIDMENSVGTNKLIYDGATIIVSPQFFLEELSKKYNLKSHKVSPLANKIEMLGGLGGDEIEVLSVIGGSMLSLDEILSRSSISQSDVRLALTKLILSEEIIERDGMYYKS